MNKPIKIDRQKFRNIYFASDFHYNHQRDFLWKPRGFDSFEAHDRFLEAECDKLQANDLLIYLGDFSLNSSPEQSMNLMNRINAKVFYVFGNHEAYHARVYENSLKEWKNANCLNYLNYQIFPFSVNKTDNNGDAGYSWNTNEVVYFGEEGYFHIGNSFFFCRHMAPLIWDKMKYDNYYAICGHSHGNSPQLNVNAKEGKILDVGVDNAIKYNGSAFFKVEEIDAIMKNKPIKIFDHHGDKHI